MINRPVYEEKRLLDLVLMMAAGKFDETKTEEGIGQLQGLLNSAALGPFSSCSEEEGTTRSRN